MRRFLLAFLVVVAAAESRAQGGPGASSVLVEAALPRQGAIRQTITAYGSVLPQPAGLISVSFLHSGQVVRLRVRPGQSVPAGAALLDFAADPSATLAYEHARSDLDFATGEEQRTRELVKDQLATVSQLEQAAKAMRDARAALRTAEQQGAGRKLETLRAPAGGVLTTLSVSEGDRVQAGAPVAQIALASALVATVGVLPEERERLRPGASVTIERLGVGSSPLAGRVAAVASEVDPKTGLIDVFARPASGAGLVLMPGEHVQATIEAGEIKGWIVPREAVLADGGGSYVFQVVNGRARRVNVSILGSNSAQRAIAGPLDPRQPVVSAGNYQLNEGMTVRFQVPLAADAAAQPAQPQSSSSTGGGR